MWLAQLVMVVNLALGGYAQTDGTEGIPVVGGCLARLLVVNDTLIQVQSNPNSSSPMLVVKRRGSSHGWPPLTEIQSPNGQALYSNESRVDVMDLTQAERAMVRHVITEY